MRFPSLRRRWIPYAVLAGSLLLTGAASYYARVTAKTRDELRFQTWISEIGHGIESRLGAYIALLHGGRGLFAATDHVTREQFKEYIDGLELERRYPGIQGIGFSIRIRPEELDDLTRRMRREHHSNFQVRPAESRSEYHSIIYLEPLDRRNRAAIGYDMFTDPVRRAAMERARDTGLPAASGKVILVQEIDEQKQAGFLIYLPVYRAGASLANEEERRSALLGFVYSPFRTGDLLHGIPGSNTEPRVDFQIYDGEVASPEHLLFQTDPSSIPHSPRLSSTSRIEVAGQPWTLVFTSRPEFDRYSEHRQVPLIFGSGLIISLALFLVIRFQTRANEKVERVARDLLTFQGALRESEDRYRTITETASDVIVTIDEHGAISSINRAVEDVFGYTRAEMLGEPLTKLMPDYRRLGHPARSLETARGHFSWEHMELSGLHRDGSEIPLEAAFGEFIRDGERFITGVLRDITERKRTEQALQQSEQLFRTLATHAPVGIFLTDARGDCQFVNERWSEIAGLAADEAKGQGWIEALHPEDRDAVTREWYVAAQTGREFNLDYRFRTPAGKETWIHGRAIALHNEAGEITGFLGTLLDLTERKRAEEEREKLLQRERAARARAEEASRLKDEFLATVSHELRTPLNSILGWASVLRRVSGDPNALRQGIETIERNAKAQAQIIEDILDVSRIITGRLRLDVKPIDPLSVIAEAVESIRPAADAKEIRLRSISHGDAGLIPGDPQRLQQIVWNLLSNAVKFTPRGGRVEVQFARNNSHAEIIVSDSGQGISPEFLPFVFDRFRQEDSSITRKHGGLGLGLAIARHLTELHGGSVSAESAGEGRGATFTVRLPVLEALPRTAVERDHPGSADAPAKPSDRLPQLEGARVLVIDDEPDTLVLLQTVLERCGAEVRVVESAAQGFEEAKGWRPDLIVSDIGMPEEDGYSFIKRVREWEKESGARIPAAALTAYAREEDRLRALSAGFQIYFSKPVDPMDLARAAASLIARSK